MHRIYIVQSGDSHYFKVGWTRGDVARRCVKRALARHFYRRLSDLSTLP
jgi:hypothetical protein